MVFGFANKYICTWILNYLQNPVPYSLISKASVKRPQTYTQTNTLLLFKAKLSFLILDP